MILGSRSSTTLTTDQELRYLFLRDLAGLLQELAKARVGVDDIGDWKDKTVQLGRCNQ